MGNSPPSRPKECVSVAILEQQEPGFWASPKPAFRKYNETPFIWKVSNDTKWIKTDEERVWIFYPESGEQLKKFAHPTIKHTYSTDGCPDQHFICYSTGPMCVIGYRKSHIEGMVDGELWSIGVAFTSLSREDLDTLEFPEELECRRAGLSYKYRVGCLTLESFKNRRFVR